MIANFIKAVQTGIGEQLGGARLYRAPNINFVTCPKDMKGEFGLSVNLMLWASPALALTMLRLSGDWFFGFLWLFAMVFAFLAHSRQRFFERHFAPPKLRHIVSRRK